PLSGSSDSDTGTNVDATGETGEPDHAGVSVDGSGNLNSVWWVWTAPSNGGVTIDTFGSDFDTTLGVYTGTAVNLLTEKASNDDSGGLQSQVVFTAQSGTTYYIAVDGFFDLLGRMALNRDVTPPPAGEAWA